MGKILIIKGADFSQNACDNINIDKTVKYIPNLVSKNITNFNSSLYVEEAYLSCSEGRDYIWRLRDDSNSELVGKKLKGFKIRFNNRNNNNNINCTFTFKGDGADIVVSCESGNFGNGETYHDKVYMLPRTYTFQSATTINGHIQGQIEIFISAATGFTFSGALRGGCQMFRYGDGTTDLSGVSIGSFIACTESEYNKPFSDFPKVRYMPFLELYLEEEEEE